MSAGKQSPAAVVAVEALSKSYGEVKAVVDLSFAVAEGEIFGFLGPNGAGKTTTLSLIEGVCRADRGRVVVLTTHYMEEAEALCDRVAIVDRGRLVALDSPGALINRLAGLSSITTSAPVPVEALRALPCVDRVQQEGARLHLQTAEVAPALRAILDLADRYQVRLDDLQIKQPTLEDVFLHLSGQNP